MGLLFSLIRLQASQTCIKRSINQTGLNMFQFTSFCFASLIGAYSLHAHAQVYAYDFHLSNLGLVSAYECIVEPAGIGPMVERNQGLFWSNIQT